MGKKGRKLLALFMVLAMVVTYSFSVSIMSAYADNEQGEVNPKAETTQSETPDTPDPEPQSEPEPQPQPDPPAPSDSGDQDTPSGNDGGSDANTNSDNDADSGNDSESGDVVTDDDDAVGEADGSEVVTGDGEATGELIEEVIEEEEEEEVEYPEVTLHANAGGISVTLHAPEGALPEGAKLSASRVGSQAVLGAVEQRIEAQGMDMVDAVAIDVTPRDKDGHAIQPKKAVTVTFSGTGLGGGDIDVFRVSDDGSSVTEMGTSVASANTQQFSADHFTIYVSTASASDPNGDGSNLPNAEDHQLVLDYGQEVTLRTSINVGGWDRTSWSIEYTSADAAGACQWNGRTHHITNINTSNAEQTVKITHKYEKYKFGTWNQFEDPVYEDFYVTLKPEVFTVTFYFQDAGETGFTKVMESTAFYNSSVEAQPEYKDTKTVGDATYTLYAWYTDDTFQTEADLDHVTANIDVYGKYAGTAKIHFNKNTSNAVSDMPEDIEAPVGNTVHLGGAPSQTGYSFNGWKDNDTGETYLSGASVVMPENGMTLYAQWTERTSTTYINYYNGGLRPIHTDTFVRGSQTEIWSQILQGPPGMVFRGWSTSALPGAQPEYLPGQSITREHHLDLYAVWGELEFDTRNVTLETYGRTVPYRGTPYTVEGVKPYNGNEADANGFILIGRHHGTGWWDPSYDIYANVSGITTSGTDVGHYSTPVTAPLYYQFDNSNIKHPLFTYVKVKNTLLIITPVSLNITTDSAEKVYDGKALTAGGKVTFETYDENEQPVTYTSKFTYEGGPVELVAGETLNLRTVGSQTEVGESSNEYEYDWGKPDGWGGPASTASRFNYEFAEASEDSIGTLTVYNGILFDANAGGDEVTNMPETLKVEEPTVQLPDNVPVRSNYEFLGWAKKASAKKADYQPGQTITLTSDDFGDGSMTLYAVWKANEEPTPSPTPTPTPDTDDTTGGGGGGDNGTAAAANIAAAADDLTAEIGDDETPEAVIADNPAPKSAPVGEWALLNLLAAILTIIGAAFAAFRKNSATSVVKGVGLASAAAAVVVFLVTQDLSAPMQIADGWTVLMAGLFGVQCVTTGVTMKTPEVD